MLNARMINILRKLMSADQPLTSEYLANVIQVTSRTIRNDIKELEEILNKNGALVKSSRGRGYELVVEDEALFRKWLKEMFQQDLSTVPNCSEERVQYLIKRLLLTEEYVKLEELADELFVSKSTVQNDLREVKNILKTYEIELEKRPNYGLKLKGKEMKLRFCMSEYIFSRKEIDSKAEILPKEEMEFIHQVILEQVHEHQITMSDVRLHNLMIHIAIACKRIRSGNYVSMFLEEIHHISRHKEYEIAKNIIQKIQEQLHVLFPSSEVAYITIHLLGTNMIVHSDLVEQEIESYIDRDVYQIVTDMLEVIENKLALGVNHDKELIIAMCLHLKPAINRYRYGMNLRNPMLEAIKSSYPVAFEAGIIAGMVLKEKTGIEIDAHEIGFLALHIGAAIERKKISNRPKKCLIVCASGVGSAKLLQYKLQDKFSTKLDILGTTEFYKLKQRSLEGIDFIISTIPIHDKLPIPVIEVNAILGGEDFKKIETIISESDEVELEYTNEQLVFLNQPFETKEEVLEFLCAQLQRLGLVNETFKQSVLEREAISPTCFGNLVAIPHPLVPQTDKTFWAICTLEKPIIWADKRVQFVCLLSVEKNSKADLQKMYKMLGGLVDDYKKVQQLLKCQTYQQFLGAFLNNQRV
ncbi:lichenan operon transcriptional antiterminator [Anoxybacillus tepidamans]|uniref:Lichenan operon transcriptional antiterminator n=1 Tax=Anoxybacteroides tepidamans TaxID=265948 RepID=A0A7W8ISR8_9BACL|nr:BglG family transcription antiterminator [Anoxybacillus tepidamans]MBB5326075.1 lichenan operon transcriptional antiterminator [Anoxybacillus tepidamans]